MFQPLPGFDLDVQRSRLLRDGQDVDLEPKVFDLLCYLIEHPHRLITKQELKRQVWHAERLSDGVTANAIAKLRRALGQDGEAAAPIETVRGRGYIFHPPQAPSNVAQAAERQQHEPAAHEEQDPLVGRAATLEELTKKLERSRSGAATLVMIRGPAGIGKTRIVREVMRQAESDGTPAWVGEAYEGEGFPAYWPWMQVVRDAQRSAPAAFARALPKGAVLLPQWVPGLGTPSPEGAQPDLQAVRFRLFDELTRCLRALASEGPKLIVLEDLQWADAGSIELLGHVIRALGSSPLLFVTTLREEEPLSRGLSDALSKLSRVATRLRLTGLTEDESRVLAHALRIHDPPSDTQLRELFQRSGGNPFFIRQFLEWWTEVGGDQGRRHETPPAARDLIRRRLALLPPAARNVLAAASVLGAKFRASRLSEMLRESPHTVLEALSAGSRLTMLIGLPGTDEFAFTHALLQETLYEDLDLQTRGVLHSRAADTLGAVTWSVTAEHLGERARHLVHALPTRLTDAVQACEGAAKAAQQSAGFERANDLLTVALNKLEVERAPAEEQARLWIELGDNHYFAAGLDLAWKAYRRAAELLRSSGGSERLAGLTPQLVRCVNMGAGDAEFARTIIDEVLNTLPPSASRERGCTLAKKAQLSWDLSRAERTALLDEAAASSDSLVQLEVAYARAVLRDPGALESNAQAALDLLTVIDSETAEPTYVRYRTLHLLGAHTTQYLCAATACDLDGVERAQTALTQLAETSHVRAAELVVALTQAGRAVAEGRLDDAAAIAASGEAWNDAFWIRAAFRTYQLMLLEARGAMALLEKLELPPLPEGAGSALRLRTDFALLHAYLYIRTRRPEKAREMLRQVSARDIERMPVLYGDLGALTGLATIYIETGDQQGMRLAYSKLSPFAGRNALLACFAYRGAVDHYLGRLALTLGDTRRAREHLQAAVAINRHLRMPRETAESATLLASLG